MTAVAHIYGTPEADRFDFSLDSDTVDVVYALGGRDVVTDGRNDGYWSDDEFHGQAGDDILISHDGNGRLFGGIGADQITVRCNWLRPIDNPFEWPAAGETTKEGFNVSVVGGRGEDTLTITNSAGASVEHDGNDIIIHTRFGGTISAHGIEHLVML